MKLPEKYRNHFAIGGLIVLGLISIWIFGFIIPNSQKKKDLEAQLAQTNAQLVGGRLSTEETQRLLAKRKVLLQEIIKLY